MAETWQQKALGLGKIINEAARKHPELAPLYTSWMNFVRKRQLSAQNDDADALRALLERHGLTLVAKQDVEHFQATIINQAEEIKALEHRITTLLRP